MNRKRRMRYTRIGLLLSVILLFSLAACGRASEGRLSEKDKSFPAFEGQDLEGIKKDSSLFASNAVTVVNFWFSSCEACVSELGALNELNESLREKGGAVIGINTDTFGGQEKALEEARSILAQKNAGYTNLWVAEDSELADFTKKFLGYPVSCVVDRSGKLVGKPIMGGIDHPSVMEALQKQIDEALSR